MFRDIVTYRCFECKNEWVAPKLDTTVKCPKCHSDRTASKDARRENAPLQ